MATKPRQLTNINIANDINITNDIYRLQLARLHTKRISELSPSLLLLSQPPYKIPNVNTLQACDLLLAPPSTYHCDDLFHPTHARCLPERCHRRCSIHNGAAGSSVTGKATYEPTYWIEQQRDPLSRPFVQYLLNSVGTRNIHQHQHQRRRRTTKDDNAQPFSGLSIHATPPQPDPSTTSPSPKPSSPRVNNRSLPSDRGVTALLASRSLLPSSILPPIVTHA
ncbi:hypothetical protein BDN70DRAFT_995799 [Pholiota conissans]|uniref:Uncharacterized protein n=1 Tax=Pholiota conissans TaxID=109636 RepID=A0A9P5YVL3_9AGAR|nr:hypothetical protein BDN70DRAFT_995799 [Pholiota conissans]